MLKAIGFPENRGSHGDGHGLELVRLNEMTSLLEP